jgi:hypothetical protein
MENVDTGRERISGIEFDDSDVTLSVDFDVHPFDGEKRIRG